MSSPAIAREGARGKIKSLDLDAVRNYPGVVAVLTAKDIPGVNDCSPSIGGDPILADGEIEFHGQVIFAVVAETRDAARRAARLGQDRNCRREAGGDRRRCGRHADQGRAAAIRIQTPRCGQGTWPPPPIASRRASWSAARSISISKARSAWPCPRKHGGMIVYSSTQHPTEVQHLIAKMLGVPDALVTCECRRMGGAFGGKESQAAQWAALAALTARVDRPPRQVPARPRRRHDHDRQAP